MMIRVSRKGHTWPNIPDINFGFLSHIALYERNGVRAIAVRNIVWSAHWCIAILSTNLRATQAILTLSHKRATTNIICGRALALKKSTFFEDFELPQFEENVFLGNSFERQ